MVQVDIDYLGNLRCKSIHEPSSNTLLTDAPKDNQGNGESFSPTDLVGTALGSCMLTTMGILAKRLEVDLVGTKVRVLKDMVADPHRRIGRLIVSLHLPSRIATEFRERLEAAARGCPVVRSIHPDTKLEISVAWDV